MNWWVVFIAAFAGTLMGEFWIQIGKAFGIL